ncbi:MAG: hypothetical protein AB2693_25360 [Candidatus Thiodiazotropha sp.]
MDITLLCKLAFHIFKDKMSADEEKYINKLKKERDCFLHSEILEDAKVDEHDFNQKWKRISTLLIDMAGAIGGTDCQSEIQAIIETAKQCSPNFLETFKILKGWCESNEELTKTVEKILTRIDELTGKL